MFHRSYTQNKSTFRCRPDRLQGINLNGCPSNASPLFPWCSQVVLDEFPYCSQREAGVAVATALSCNAVPQAIALLRSPNCLHSSPSRTVDHHHTISATGFPKISPLMALSRARNLMKQARFWAARLAWWWPLATRWLRFQWRRSVHPFEVGNSSIIARRLFEYELVQ